jgi:hypothetical protein
MYANKPEMAARWQKHTPPGAILPQHVAKKKHKEDPTRLHFRLAQGRYQVPDIDNYKK